MTRVLIVLTVLVMTTAAAPQPSRVHKLEELTWPQIEAFDRNRTVFILPVGMLEEHGPHLPIAADTFGSSTKRIATRSVSAVPCPTGTWS